MNNLEKLQNKINYQFSNEQLLHEALTHTSYSNEQHLPYNYERLEFLGDSILQMVTSDYLLNEYPNAREGQLTQYRVALVSEPILSKKAKEIGLNQYILLGKGEEKTGGRNKSSILCDIVEALIGAIYKDCHDYDTVEAFIYDYLIKDTKLVDTDHKSQLQDKLGAKADKLEYVLINQTGTDHEPIFTIQAVLDGTVLGIGQAHNKKQAEQMAAKMALKQMK